MHGIFLHYKENIKLFHWGKYFSYKLRTKTWIMDWLTGVWHCWPAGPQNKTNPQLYFFFYKCVLIYVEMQTQVTTSDFRHDNFILTHQTINAFGMLPVTSQSDWKLSHWIFKLSFSSFFGLSFYCQSIISSCTTITVVNWNIQMVLTSHFLGSLIVDF